jgi:hypothetical protein
MISLHTNMHGYYTQADGIPQYINMLEDAQKKAKRAGMPIADVELVMMASAAVLAAQHFPREVDDWEGLPSGSRTWLAWKKAFRLAHLKHQRQILASRGGEALGGAHGVLPGAAPTLGQFEKALDNLALAATNDTVVLQQLTVANLALMATIGTAHRSQQDIGGRGGTWRGNGDAGDSSRYVGGTGKINDEASPWELLLYPWSSHQQVPHQCHLRQQGDRPSRRRHGGEHLRR